MAGIEATISLKDGVSSTLRSIEKSLGKLITTLDSINAKFDKLIDPNAFAASKTAINGVNTTLGNMGNKAVEVANTTGKITTAVEGVAGAFQLTQNQMHKIEKLSDEIALSEHARLGHQKAIAKLRAAEEVDLHAIEGHELAINNLLSGEQLKRDAIFKQIDDAANASGKVVNAAKRQEILDNRLLVSRENLKKATLGVEKATLAVEATQNRVSTSAAKVEKAQEAVRTQVEATNNAKLRGVNIELQIENTKKRGAALDKAAADREERKIAKINKGIQALSQQYAIQRMIASTQSRYAGGIERVNQKYSEAKRKVIELERSIDRTNKLEMLQLQSAKQICSQRQKLVDLTNNLVQTRIRLNALEIQGKNHGVQAFIQRRKEASIKRDIANTSRQILSIERQTKAAIDQCTQAQNKFNFSQKQSVSSSNMIWGKLKGIAGAYLGIQSVGSVIKTADALAANEARLNLMVKEGESVDQLSNQIYEAAMRSRSGYLQMADSVAKVGIQAGNLFNNSGDMVRFMETFNKMGVISKATTQQTNAAMTQLIQALSFGQLRGDELKSILENMPMVAHALADELTRTGQTLDGLPDKLKHIAADGKVTADEIRELGYEGQISAETVVNAMLNGANKIDKMAKNMTWTWGQVWTVFKNAALKAFTPVLNGITKIISTKRFQRFADWVGKTMDKIGAAMKNLFDVLSPVLAAIFDKVAAIGNFITKNWSFIAPIIWGIVAALASYKTAIMLAAIWTGISTAARVVATFFTWMFTKATLAQAAAQWGLNAAMYACPLTWIIVAIIAVIVVIYLVVAAINHWAGTTYSATGFICGCIYSLLVFLYNFVAQSWNALAGLLEHIVNFWNHPIYTWRKSMVNLALLVIDGFIAMTDGCNDFCEKFANGIVEAINVAIKAWNGFVSVMESVGMAGVLGISKGELISSEHKSTTSALKDLRAKIANSAGEAPKDYWTAPRMELKSIPKAFNKGYEWGANKADKLSNIMSGKGMESLVDLVNGQSKQSDFAKALGSGFDNPSGSDLTDPSGSVKNPALDKIAGNTDDIAKNTGATADNTAQEDDEFFKYLRMSAERKGMNRSQLMNLKIDMNNVNHIKSGTDAEEVYKIICRAVYDEVVNKLEAIPGV